MKDNFPWSGYYLIIIFMVLGAILFEVGYWLQYYERAMSLGMELGLWLLLSFARWFMYSVVILLISVGIYIMVDKIYNK